MRAATIAAAAAQSTRSAAATAICHSGRPKGRRNMAATGAVKGMTVSHEAKVPAGARSTRGASERGSSSGAPTTSVHCVVSASLSSRAATAATRVP